MKKFYFPKEYSESHLFQEIIQNQCENLLFDTNLDNLNGIPKNILYYRFQQSDGMYQSKIQVKDQLKFFYEYNLYELFLNKKYSNEDILKCYKSCKCETIFAQSTENKNIFKNDELNQRILKKFESIYMNESYISESKKNEINIEFNKYVIDFISNFIKNCGILLENTDLSNHLIEEELLISEIHPEIKTLYDIINEIKQIYKINKNLIALKEIENDSIKMDINSTLYKMLAHMKIKSDYLLSKIISNYEEDLILKEISFENKYLRLKQCEFKIFKEIKSQKNSESIDNKSLDITTKNFNIKKEFYKNQKIKAINRIKKLEESNDDELKKYIQKIKSIEKQIKYKKELINNLKKK